MAGVGEAHEPRVQLAAIATVRWQIFGLIGERGFAFSDVDVLENPFVSGFVDHRADGDAWFFRVADAQASGRA